jgi:hypothetical protein
VNLQYTRRVLELGYEMLILLYTYLRVEGSGNKRGFELDNLGSCSFFQVGAYKLGGWCLLLVGAGKY